MRTKAHGVLRVLGSAFPEDTSVAFPADHPADAPRELPGEKRY